MLTVHFSHQQYWSLGGTADSQMSFRLNRPKLLLWAIFWFSCLFTPIIPEPAHLNSAHAHKWYCAWQGWWFPHCKDCRCGQHEEAAQLDQLPFPISLKQQQLYSQRRIPSLTNENLLRTSQHLNYHIYAPAIVVRKISLPNSYSAIPFRFSAGLSSYPLLEPVCLIVLVTVSRVGLLACQPSAWSSYPSTTACRRSAQLSFLASWAKSHLLISPVFFPTQSTCFRPTTPAVAGRLTARLCYRELMVGLPPLQPVVSQ